MSNLKELSDMELVTVLTELENLPSESSNITVSWVKVPEFSNDDVVSKALELRSGRVTKPIFVLNLKAEIRNILADRYVTVLKQERSENIKIAIWQ